MKSKFKNSTFLLGGDFNLPDINWTTEAIESHQYLKETNTTFLDSFRDLGLKQIITSPTRFKYKFFDLAEKQIKTKFNAEGTVLDLFLTNCENLVESSSVVSGIGDHEFVTVKTRLIVPHKKTQTQHPPLETREYPKTETRCLQL